ncbi:MAG: malonic semialdehyde reductase [Pseudomonadota bacterium]
MTKTVSDDGLDVLFREARTLNGWSDQPVSDVHIKAIYELLKWAPTSANCSPARFVFVTSSAAKEKLVGCLDEGNVEKTREAPLTVIIGHDLRFHDHLPKLFPHTDAKAWFEGNDAKIAETAMRNGTLQGAYLMMAARSLGFDCGPMSGFDPEKVEAAFFDGTSVKANFLCNIGHGTEKNLFPRSPRFAFEEACRIA